MIASLRKQHFRAWLLLALVLPIILLTSWYARRPLLMMDRLPNALTEGAKP